MPGPTRRMSKNSTGGKSIWEMRATIGGARHLLKEVVKVYFE